MRTHLSEDSLTFLQHSPHRRVSRFRYFHQDNARFLRRIVQSKSKVLLVVFDASPYLRAMEGMALTILDLDPLASTDPTEPVRRRVTHLADLDPNEEFDLILLPYALQFLGDIQSFLATLDVHLKASGRLVFLQYNFLWAPIFRLAQMIGVRQKLPDLNWLNINDLENLFTLSGLEVVTSGHRCLFPVWVPLLTPLFNRWLAPLPFLRRLALTTFVIARRRTQTTNGHNQAAPSVSIIVPVRNEAGNIQSLLDRLPVLSRETEVLFIEGHSTDSSWDEIQQQCQSHAKRKLLKLQALRQTGEGKADAIRLGFSMAKGDILMILDADLSVQPEDLFRFYDVLCRRYVDFLNGSRLIYRMESEAMRILNLTFNKIFAWTIAWLIGQPVKDSLCGTKAMYRSDFELLKLHYPGLFERDPFGDFSLLFGASQLLLKIGDVPIRYKRRTYGTTNIHRYRDGWRLLRFCLYFWGRLKY